MEKGGRSRRPVNLENKIRKVKEARVRMDLYALVGGGVHTRRPRVTRGHGKCVVNI